ncbi:MAG TPA: LuxR C-terminal-related transcriptional regulator [Solirubrobacteraceae bacterium]|nr:LuxR C-terminal-related transcriptional regulator [Solirubrobacteraceae bacterium]
MLICDDERRCVDVNVAACLLLRLARDVILRHSIDEFVAPESRPDMRAMWPTFVQRRQLPLSTLACDLAAPDGARVPVTLSVASFEPGRHLAIIDYAPVREHVDRVQQPTRRGTLTRREREVLTLVAHGRTGVEIATQLFLSPTTVQTHVNNALVKLNAKNRANGVAIAYASGEIDGRTSETYARPASGPS